ncbi:transient receptor potential cation channel subfamily M member 2 isoform X1 [Lingula anatina]|uniref:Transient receptor potential cation channel subfamily M member 2 isoform X1 n=1 Tax=Lingula anatina TaxID=7574 RepID=A0A1S3HH51_LINAN|nr:transient receptor potential cation channel subfamily M member 2 isoform X1 [Lingula anatina]XP_013384360.1 transient receptor potential cation channel subfamily M member 2 isoform X1 [Lingula anatina]|eukprot:XP_013384358.1 transient receptor potential cation channel subfamily M member 2 isoform X1 [Lingula anatina]
MSSDEEYFTPKATPGGTSFTIPINADPPPRQIGNNRRLPSLEPRPRSKSPSKIPKPVPNEGATFTGGVSAGQDIPLNSTFRISKGTEPLLGKTPLSSSTKHVKHKHPHGKSHAQRGEAQNLQTVDEGKEKHKKRKTKRKHARHGTGESTGTFTIESKQNSNGSTGTFTVDNPAFEGENVKTASVASMQSRSTYIMSTEDKVEDEEAPVGFGLGRQLTKSHRKDARESDMKIKHRFTLNKAKIRSYVSNQIFHRECSAYIPDPKKLSEGMCQCGRSKTWHVDEEIDISKHTKDEKWNGENHSEQVPPDCFGEILFSGFGYDNKVPAPYIRVDHTTERSTLWHLLDDYWKLPAPRLIITVTGGAQKFFLRPRLLHAFKTGLINAATGTGAWVVSGGTNTGVMKLVGEAVRDHSFASDVESSKIIALGVATWGIISNKESLVGEENMGCFPALYRSEDLRHGGAGTAALDPNHTHYIFVDDGTENKYGAEIKLRAKLEQYISEKVETGISKTESVPVPIILLVLEGGINTLQTVAEAVKQDTPVVIIGGSGRAADYLICGYKMTRSKEKGKEEESQYPSNFEDEMAEEAKSLFDLHGLDQEEVEKNIKKCLKNLKICLDHRKLLTVFRLNDSTSARDMDKAILYALLKANKSDARTQLNLALAWNRPDVARQQIFTQDNRENWQKVDLYPAMYTALVQDRLEFVHLFLDMGVDLKKFLTASKLQELYYDVLKDRFSGAGAFYLKEKVQQLQQSFASRLRSGDGDHGDLDQNSVLYNIGRVINRCVQDQQDNLYASQKPGMCENQPSAEAGLAEDMTNQRYTEVNEVDERVNTISQCAPGAKMKKKRTKLKEEQKCEFERPEKHLMLWAVLLNRKELAKLFWKMGKDHIGAALFASAILKRMSKDAAGDEEVDLAEDLKNHGVEFEELAVGVLNECYSKDKILGHRLVTRQLPHFGHDTVMTIADTARQMHFMEQACCQTKLNMIWLGKMVQHTSIWKIVPSLFIPFVIPFIKFRIKSKPLKSFSEVRGIDLGSVNRIAPEAEKKNGDEEEENSDPDGDGVEFTRSKTRREKNRKGAKHSYFQVNCCGLDKDSISIFRAFYYFHTAPITKFLYQQIMYIVFLCMFSYFLMVDLHPMNTPDNLHIWEIFVWIFSGTSILEEVRQVLTKDSRSLWYKLADWWKSVWNKLDLIMYTLFIISVVLRFTLTEADFVHARRAYCLTLILHFVRFLQGFMIHKDMGPKVIMIRRMITDVIFFVMILLVFLLAYGVAVQALLYPNHKRDWSILKDVVYIPYWQMYGDLFLDETSGKIDQCTSNATLYLQDNGPQMCPQQNEWMTIVLMVIYMLLTNVLLLNLLIAIFNYTFQNIQDNSLTVWRFYRFGLIYEYHDRPPLPPPAIIISHIVRGIMYIVKKCRGIKNSDDSFKRVLSVDEQEKLTVFEKAGMESYLLRTHQENEAHMANKISTAGERIEQVIDDLEQIKEQIEDQNQTSVPGLNSTFNPPVEPELRQSVSPADETADLQKRLKELEDQVSRQTNHLEQVLKLLQQHGYGGPAGDSKEGMTHISS